MDFDGFVRDIRENRWQVYGVEVYENGVLACRWGDTDTRYPIYSVTKSLVSLAVGMAVDEGKMDVGKSVLRYLPKETVSVLPKNQRAVYEKIPVRQLLSMSVRGYPFRPEGENWLEHALRLPLQDAETPAFDYSNVSAYLVGVAAACALDTDLYACLKRRVFEPLGIADPPYLRSPEGYFYGASGMELSVSELSRLGLMLSQGGVWRGERIVSAEYLREATSVQQMNREGGYGYFFWKYRGGFSMNGKWGQKCYVLPKQKRIVTFLSHLEEGSGQVRESMEKYLLGTEQEEK